MKTKILILSMLLLAGTATALAQSGTCGPNLTWTLENGTLTISGTGAMPNFTPWDLYSSSITTVVIENGVTSIGYGAFSYCRSLTEITIPNSVTSIGYEAFDGCSGLTSITIPNSVTSIGSDAFYMCSGLTSITIPSSVTSIGRSAFAGTEWLNKQPDGCIYIGKILYEYKGNMPDNTVINVKEGTLKIGEGAFRSCSGLTSITISNSVTSIREGAFSGCSGLTDIIVENGNANYSSEDGVLFNKDKTELIVFPGGGTGYTILNSVTSIREEAFSGCTKLTSITIPNSVTNIGGGAFSGCSKLSSITIPNSVTNIGGVAFSGCTKLTSITIPASVTSIGRRAFDGCTKLTSITIPNGVTSIGEEAFYGCSGLTSITIPNSVTSIGGDAFSGCSGLTSITIPNSVTSIGGGAFSGTEWLNKQPDGCIYIGKVLYKYKGNMPDNTVINVKEGTLGIGGNAFSGCSGLTSITIPNSVTSIGSRAFSHSGLTSITIPNSVTSIGGGAFEGTEWLNKQPDGCIYIGKILYEYKGNMPDNTVINVKEGTLGIGGNAFSGCNGLTSITIPNSVTGIGEYAFSRCNGLTSITIPNSVTGIGEYAFSGCSILASITIPNSVTSIGKSALEGCSELISITIPASVTSIGDGVFANCISLSSVTNLNPTPQSITSNVFYDVDLSNVTLYVPAEAIAAYQKAHTWKDFGTIRGYVPSAIHVPAAESAIGIYPNPVSESFRISGLTTPTQVVIADVSGKTVLRQTVKGNENIAIGHLPKGVYLVKIISGNQSVTKKIIKQ